MKFCEWPSPNQNSRGGIQLELVILHYTGMASFHSALERLRSPKAQVSCHYLIRESGEVFRLVDESRRAWHAGEACWGGWPQVNARSIGIELAHPGHRSGVRSYAEAQLLSLESVLSEIMERWGIPPEGVLGHSDVAPCRKRDPGEWFPWNRFAAANLAVWRKGPRGGGRRLSGTECRRLQAALSEIGYCVPSTGRPDAATRAAFHAFQRRFRPGELGAPADIAALRHAQAVASDWSARRGD